MPSLSSADRSPESGGPSFESLMEERYLTPKRVPILDHKSVIEAAVQWLGNKAGWWWIEREMALPQNDPPRIADVIAWNRREKQFYIIEAKAGWKDFHRDRKFLDYRKWCNWFAFAMPEELVQAALRRMDDVQDWYEGVGLLLVPNGFGPRRMVRRPKKRGMPKDLYWAMVEQCAASSHSRLFDARLRINQLELGLKN